MNKLELAPDCIKNINWDLLKKQKYDLLESIIDLKLKAKKAYSAGEERVGNKYTRQVTSLIGILHLIDNIQEYATDVCEVNEKLIYDV